jgi:hypothetical protein
MLLKCMTVANLHHAMVQRGTRRMDETHMTLFMHAVPEAETLL